MGGGLSRKNVFEDVDLDALDNVASEYNSLSSMTATTTHDGLPLFEPVTSPLKYEYTYLGKSKTLIFDWDTKIDHLKISPKLRKGNTHLPWFNKLYMNKKPIAIELARVLMFFVDEGMSTPKKISTVGILAEHLLDSELKTLSNFRLVDFDKMGDIFAKSRGHDGNIIRNILNLSPSIPENIKEQISSYRPSPRIQEGKKTSFEKRVKNANLNNDYSDYVMFQIYAYLNVCIMEISDSVMSTKAIVSNNNDIGFFTQEGFHNYKELISKGSKESFDKAFQIEMSECYKINDALDCIYSYDKSQDIFSVFLQLAKNGYYEDAFNALPQELQENENIVYLCRDVFPYAIGNTKKIHTLIFNGIWKKEGIRFTSWSLRLFENYRNDHSFHKNSKKFKHYVLEKHFIYRAFYGAKSNKNLGNTRGEGVHNILLGRTRHFDFLLMVLLMCESGRNFEVINTIPARVSSGDYSLSILENEDRFVSEASILLYGFKYRGHFSVEGAQQEEISITTSSALFKFLNLFKDINSKLRLDSDTFFTDDKIISAYSINFTKFCQIKDRDGEILTSFDTRKFRKVFAGESLNRWMKDIKNTDDLVSAVANDLKNTIPLTYLLQSSTTEDMLSTSIVGLQMKFLETHLLIASEIKLNKEKPPEKGREKRFLCDCLDPSRPDYVANLDVTYCKSFDNCLGCSRGVVYEEHLPNIIYRGFQYEEILRGNRDLYQGQYEIKHHRANEVIEKFKRSDNGKEVFLNAFKKAVDAWEDPDTFLLPPLLINV